MRTLLLVPAVAVVFGAVVAACGGGGAAKPDARVSDSRNDAPGPDAGPDAAVCQAMTAPDPAFVRATGNPELRGGFGTADQMVDSAISDPDVHWDDTAARWELYFATKHATTCTPAGNSGVQQILHASSADGAAWQLDTGVALDGPGSAGAWDAVNTETPSVAVNPTTDAAHRYAMVYSGAAGSFAATGAQLTDYAIGVAFSADGVTFARLPAASSPHAEAGLVLTGADVYPTSAHAVVADPEILYRDGTYHLWFSSFACTGDCVAGTTITAFGIGHATSTDAIHWTPDAQNPVASLLRTPGTPTSGGGQPSVVYDTIHCRWEMWLHSDLAGETASQPVAFNNMAGVWHATSPDAVTWTIDYAGARDLTWTQTASGEDLGLLTGADVGAHGDERLMVYVGFDDHQVPAGCELPPATGNKVIAGVFALDEAVRGAP